MTNEHMRILLFVVISMSLHIRAMEESRYLSKRELRRIEIETLEEKIERYPKSPAQLKLSWSESLAELTEEDKAETEKKMVGSLLNNDTKSRSRQEQKETEEEEEEPDQKNPISVPAPHASSRREPIEEERWHGDEESGNKDDRNQMMEHPSENSVEKLKQLSMASFAKLFSFSWWWPATMYFFSAKLLRFTFWKMPLFGGSAGASSNQSSGGSSGGGHVTL